MFSFVVAIILNIVEVNLFALYREKTGFGGVCLRFFVYHCTKGAFVVSTLDITS